MEIFPLYSTCHPQWTRRCQYNSQSPFLMRDLAAVLLSDALSSNSNRVLYLTPREPEKWTQKLKLTNFHPDDVKVSVNDDTVRIHAKHVIGDESDCQSYEVRRTVKIPDNVDSKTISVKMNSNGNLVIEGPYNKTEKEPACSNQTEATSHNVCVCENDCDKIESNIESQETEETKDFEMSLNLASFEPNDISVTCEDNILKVQAKSEHKEDGLESSRYFYRECTLPQNVDVSDIKCIRADDGTVSLRVPHVNKKSITTTVEGTSIDESEQNESIQSNKEVQDIPVDNLIENENTDLERELEANTGKETDSLE